MAATRTRAYRFLVTVYIEGEEPPTISDVGRHIADAVHDADDRNLQVDVVGIEIQDFRGSDWKVPMQRHSAHARSTR